MLSPERQDPFAAPSNKRNRGYRDIMAEQSLQNERSTTISGTGSGVSIIRQPGSSEDDEEPAASSARSTASRTSASSAGMGAPSKTIAGSSLTPHASTATPNRWGATPVAAPARNRWDLTPAIGAKRTGGATPTPRGWGLETPVQTPGGGKSRWD